MLRLLRALWNKIMGVFGGVAESIEEDPDVIAATYDASIKQSKNRVAATRSVIAKLMSIQEKRRAALNNLTASIDKLNKIKAGATAEAKSVVQRMQAQGATPDQIKANSDIIAARAAVANAESQIAKKLTESSQKEEEIRSLEAKLNGLKADLQSMEKNASNLSQEKESAIADVITAKEMAKVNDLISGVSQEATDVALERAREATMNVVNKAKLASEMAGLDANRQDDKYIYAAEQAQSDSEFDALIGLETKVSSETPLDAAKLPEN
jgi:chromosome segregation ATPase